MQDKYGLLPIGEYKFAAQFWLEVKTVGEVMSQKTKDKLAHDRGFGDKVEDGDWSDVTTGEVGSMVREAIKRGEQAMADEAAAEARTNGMAHQNAR